MEQPKTPFKLYKWYNEELEKLANDKLTQKKYYELQKAKRKLQKMGLLPINTKWNI